jgi:ABC-type transporter Mla MlaB component
MAMKRSPAALVLAGPIAPQDIPALCRRACTLAEGSDAKLVVCDVGGLVEPDVVAVEALARVQLTVGRLGRRVRVRNSCPELQELLAFMGLADILR